MPSKTTRPELSARIHIADEDTVRGVSVEVPDQAPDREPESVTDRDQQEARISQSFSGPFRSTGNATTARTSGTATADQTRVRRPGPDPDDRETRERRHAGRRGCCEDHQFHHLRHRLRQTRTMRAAHAHGNLLPTRFSRRSRGPRDWLTWFGPELSNPASGIPSESPCDTRGNPQGIVPRKIAAPTPRMNPRSPWE